MKITSNKYLIQFLPSTFIRAHAHTYTHYLSQWLECAGVPFIHAHCVLFYVFCTYVRTCRFVVSFYVVVPFFQLAFDTHTAICAILVQYTINFGLWCDLHIHLTHSPFPCSDATIRKSIKFSGIWIWACGWLPPHIPRFHSVRNCVSGDLSKNVYGYN